MTAEEIEIYKQDEKQAILNFVCTKETDANADAFQQRLVEMSFDNMLDFHKMINEYGAGGTCLDIGANYGSQYYSMKVNCPKVEWIGCEVAPQFITRFRERAKEDENPTIYQIEDYKSLPFENNSFDVVTSKSAHRHYSPEHGFAMIDEMLRVAKKAVVIQFFAAIELDEDLYSKPKSEIVGSKGMLVEWSKPKWDEYIADKNVIAANNTNRLFVFLKENPE